MNDVNSPATRENIINTASGINIVLGLWLVISPWVIGYTSQAIVSNNVIVGAAVVILAAIRMAARSRASVPAWLNVVLGAWLIIAPFVFTLVDAGQRWNLIIVGALVLVLALASGTAGAQRRA